MDLEEAINEFGADVELQDTNLETEHEGTEIDFQAKEVTVIKPFKPGEGHVREEQLKEVENGNEFSIYVKHRPECDCGNVVAEADGEIQLLGTCTEDHCETYVCPRCETECAACKQGMCPRCSKGHGLKDEPYCMSCRSDVVEDIGFERGMEEREQRHKEELERRKQQLEEEKQQTKLELEELKTQREQIRQDWKTIIHAINVVTGDESSEDEKEDDVFGGSGAFTGEDRFSSGVDLSSDSSEVDDWFNGIEQEMDQRLENTTE